MEDEGRYCSECGADLQEVGFMTSEEILGTNVTLVKKSFGPVFVVNESETAMQSVMCGNCGDDISSDFEDFTITYNPDTEEQSSG